MFWVVLWLNQQIEPRLILSQHFVLFPDQLISFRVQETEYLFKKTCRPIFVKCWSRGKVIKPCKLEGENGFLKEGEAGEWRALATAWGGVPCSAGRRAGEEPSKSERTGAGRGDGDAASESARTSPSKVEPPSGRPQWMLTRFWKLRSDSSENKELRRG